MTRRRVTLIAGAIALAALLATTSAFERESGLGVASPVESAHQVATQADGLVQATDDIAWEERRAADSAGWAVHESPLGLFTYRIPAGWSATDTGSHTGDGGPRASVQLSPDDIPAASEGATATGFARIELSMQPFDVPSDSGDTPVIKEVTLQRTTAAKPGQAATIQLTQFGPHPRFPDWHGVVALSIRIAGEGGMTLNAFASVHFPLDLADVDDVLGVLESVQIVPGGGTSPAPAPPATGSGGTSSGPGGSLWVAAAGVLSMSVALALFARRRSN